VQCGGGGVNGWGFVCGCVCVCVCVCVGGGGCYVVVNKSQYTVILFVFLNGLGKYCNCFFHFPVTTVLPQFTF
jgi:hypothetical protein